MFKTEATIILRIPSVEIITEEHSENLTINDFKKEATKVVKEKINNMSDDEAYHYVIGYETKTPEEI